MAQDAVYQVQLQLILRVEKNKKSCELGIKYVNEAINNNVNYGKGHGPINHLVSFDLKKRF